MLPALLKKQIDGYSTSLPFTTEAEVKAAYNFLQRDHMRVTLRRR